ncbi:type II toxin-antitoxin system PemK/MazF family toxin [Candidatus Neptunochlamydia vexilliferae]|uniref:Endoribonuclease MazF9 n=1 Tax=Candidatus Neptunichlamydia vexilliferae TaxID=1651774 RepID=A0ABS0AYD5_9BACT|nr:type II toxin-antitoxin system PemK/MazF family toxin [Candidatus Neptunochlamydia vexilliferae]MBF5059143.1 Endoribonuclease MazF9 [Candidatus Neptunochlamydia vexilliferae]
MALKKTTPKQGEIWLFDPDPINGREVGTKVRPALIISADSFNEGLSALVIVVPMTSKDQGIFSHVRFDPPEGGIKVPSFAVCEQIRSISKNRLIKKMGMVPLPGSSIASIKGSVMTGAIRPLTSISTSTPSSF